MSFYELAETAKIKQKEINRTLMENGVFFHDSDTAYISPDTQIAAGTVVYPNTTIEGPCIIGANCVIGPNSMITNSRIDDNVTVLMSVVKDSSIGHGTSVGPFAYLRPGSVIGAGVRVGDFVEIKNSNIGDGTKISHLTYVGDADVGKNVNFGCGSVTVNYDGFNKYRTTVNDNAFIGCNTNLIAPVTVNEGGYTAAGSTITGDVPADALAVARARQRNIDGWGKRKRNNEQ